MSKFGAFMQAVFFVVALLLALWSIMLPAIQGVQVAVLAVFVLLAAWYLRGRA